MLEPPVDFLSLFYLHIGLLFIQLELTGWEVNVFRVVVISF